MNEINELEFIQEEEANQQKSALQNNFMKKNPSKLEESLNYTDSRVSNFKDSLPKN